MTVSLLTLRNDLRSRLDEAFAREWSDDDLNRWLNEGATDLARRGETLMDSRAVPISAGVRQYALPGEVFRLHRAEITVDGGQTIYPLEFRDYNEMDEIWSTRQTIQQYAPAYLVPFGYPPNLKAILFPVPAANGTLTVYYYRTPVQASLDTDNIDVPSGWEDLVMLYAEYVALRKDGDQRWQEAKALYDERLEAMIESTRRYHDQAGFIVSGTHFQPGWLVNADGDW